MLMSVLGDQKDGKKSPGSKKEPGASRALTFQEGIEARSKASLFNPTFA